MKKLAGLIIVLAVLILGGYYGMGIVTENTIKKNVAIINHTNELSAEIEQYDRGFFCSSAKLQWRLHIPEHLVKDANGQSQVVPAQDYQMAMPIKIHHGPIIFADTTVKFGLGFAQAKIPFPEQYKQQFESLYTKDSTMPNLDLSIFVNYLNNSSLNLNVPNLKLVAKDGKSELTLKGIDSRTSITSNIDKVQGDFVVEGFSFSKDDAKISLSKVSSDYNLHETPAGIFLGHAAFSLPSFVVDVKNKKMFEIGDFTLNSDSDVKDNLFSSNFNASVKSIYIDGQNYGPGDVAVSLRNLDAEVLAKINEQANAMQNGNDAERQRAMLAMLPQLPKLFSKGAEFEISKFRVQLPDGLVNGHMAISLPKGNSNNPFELIQKVHGNAQLSVPKSVMKKIAEQSLLQQMNKQPELQKTIVQQLQQGQGQSSQPVLSQEQLASMQADRQLAGLEQSGLVVVKGPDYVVDISLEQGKFTVNGKPFDPSTMKF